jgi:biotin carboxylase
LATLLFLGASVSQLPAIRYAQEVGHRVVAVDGDRNAIAFPFCDVAENVDFTDLDRVIEIGSRLGVQGVLAVSTDRAVPPAAAIAARLGLPGIGVEVAQVMTNKASMRRRLEASGVPQPRHVVLAADTDVGAACAAITFPAVLKPVDSGGQRGVFRIESVDQARRSLLDVLGFSRSGRAMLEEFVDGTELNGIFVARGGEPTLVTLSDRLRPSGLGFGVGWIHSFPSSLPDDVLLLAEEVGCAAVRSLGLKDGIAFPQLIADVRGTVRVVEVAARIPAGQMADLVLFGAGVNLFEVAIEQALGHAVPDSRLTSSSRRPIAIRFLTARPGVLPVGTVSAIEGLEAVQASPGVLSAGLYFGPGTTIGPLQVDADRRGYVITTAKTVKLALELADSAAEKLVVRTAHADGSFDRGLRRLHRKQFAPIALVLALILGTTAAFVVSEQAKLQRALLLGTKVDKTFSPVCRCATDVAHVTFRLVHPERVTVQIVNSVGHPVATFLRNRAVRAGLKHFVWNGFARAGRTLPDGLYLPQVVFPALHRTLRLPSPIRLDTQRPKLLQLSVHATGSRVLARYTFDEPAHALLLVDGRRTVLTRLAATSGQLSWADRFPSGRRARPGRYRISLLGVDPAGNRSLASRDQVVRIKAANHQEGLAKYSLCRSPALRAPTVTLQLSTLRPSLPQNEHCTPRANGVPAKSS